MLVMYLNLKLHQLSQMYLNSKRYGMSDIDLCRVQDGDCVLYRDNNTGLVYLWVHDSSIKLSMEDMQFLYKQLGLFIQHPV